MATNASNIIVGAAAVAIGDGTPTSAGVTNTYNALKTAVTTSPKDYLAWIQGLGAAGTAINGVTFKDAGLTQQGIEVTYTPDYGEVEVDQLLDAAKIFKQKMSVTVRTTFAEATLENLYTVWGQTSATLTTATDKELFLVPGQLGQAPVEKHLLFVGGAASSFRQRVYLVSRAVSMEASVHSLRRNEATVFPVAFRLLPDTNSSYSSYGKVVDVA